MRRRSSRRWPTRWRAHWPRYPREKVRSEALVVRFFDEMPHVQITLDPKKGAGR